MSIRYILISIDTKSILGIIWGMSGWLTLTEAAGFFARSNGKKVSTDSLVRWIQTGIEGVCLKAEKVGGRWMTTEAWLAEFTEERTRRSLRRAPRQLVIGTRRQRAADKELQRRFFHGREAVKVSRL